jgi:hypothetical protein
MRHYLTSLHESIWDIVEFGAQEPQVGDKDYDSDEAAQIRHFNSQATSILLASLCQDGTRRGQGDQDHQARDNRWRTRSIHPQQRRGATSNVQPTHDDGQLSAQPREHQM